MACQQELDTEIVGGTCANVLQTIGFYCVFFGLLLQSEQHNRVLKDLNFLCEHILT